MIPASDGPFGPHTTALREADPMVRRYRALFGLLDWTRVPERDALRPWPGRLPHPCAAYVKALLVKLIEGKPYITQLRTFLLDHPLLVLELGFRPVLDPTSPLGFDVRRTVPGDRWLRHQQQTLDPRMLAAVFAGTVQTVQQHVPEVGETVAIDVTHLYAWVDENNPTADVAERHDPQRQPAGDPDCRLGAKRRANGKGGKRKEYLWGYGWGIAAATHPHTGDLVLAELTQPFNHQDITVFRPVYRQACTHLGRTPTNLAADAAFDAWYVYQTCATTGGIAAVPRNDRHPVPPRTPEGHPICAAGLVMTPGRAFHHERGFPARDHHCPLLRPHRTGEVCSAPQFAAGGCHKVINLAPGGQMRLNLDRTSDGYRAIYRQRTCTERIYSQAKARGLGRPKVRRLAGVQRLATLTAIVINLGVLERLTATRPPHSP